MDGEGDGTPNYRRPGSLMTMDSPCQSRIAYLQMDRGIALPCLPTLLARIFTGMVRR